MTTPFDITIDKRLFETTPGETVLDVSRRAGIEIPTLCHDPRLEPAGSCRMCLVEIEGERRLQPACSWKAVPGLEVTTTSDRIERHRKMLLALYLSDHRVDESGAPLARGSGSDLKSLALGYDLPVLEPVESPRVGRPNDSNPYIDFDPELCISCSRCTRYCSDVEGVNAIAMAGRGSNTTVTTAVDRGLLETTCELCGGCIDTCPTGAMTEKKTPAGMTDEMLQKVRTTCNYCGVGCQMDLCVADNHVVKVSSPPAGETLNDGNLCVKGRFAFDFIDHEDRLTEPMVRGDDGQLRPVTWQQAIEAAAKGLMDVKRRHGADALGVISSSRCTSEENYLAQKLARAAFGTNNCHQCAAT